MASKYELSKTYQYRKVMKPLLERKRRARINACLDDLKELMAECVQQQSGDLNAKLEKVDILELTVQHLRRLRTKQSSNACGRLRDRSSFRTGYIQAANEVSRCLASLPKVDIKLGTTLMTHLGFRLHQLECGTNDETPTAPAADAPLSINCTNAISVNVLHSPMSSGYGSDTDSLYSSKGPDAHSLQMAAASVWRPW